MCEVTVELMAIGSPAIGAGRAVLATDGSYTVGATAVASTVIGIPPRRRLTVFGCADTGAAMHAGFQGTGVLLPAAVALGCVGTGAMGVGCVGTGGQESNGRSIFGSADIGMARNGLPVDGGPRLKLVFIGVAVTEGPKDGWSVHGLLDDAPSPNGVTASSVPNTCASDGRKTAPNGNEEKHSADTERNRCVAGRR